MPVSYSVQERPYELFEKGKEEGTWNPSDIDLSRDLDDWAECSQQQQLVFLASSAGLYVGEEDVTRTLSPYVLALEELAALEDVPFDVFQEQMYLVQQLYEEAKHTDFFARYHQNVLESQDTSIFTQSGFQEDGFATDDLHNTAVDLMEAVQTSNRRELLYAVGEAYLDYMALAEGQLARVGYLQLDAILSEIADDIGREQAFPGFQEGLRYVRQDESRHIENGRWVLKRIADEEEAIVTDVYEPRFEAYICNRLLSDSHYHQSTPYDIDVEHIISRAKQYLQDTVDYIGADRFADLTEVDDFARSMEATH